MDDLNVLAAAADRADFDELRCELVRLFDEQPLQRQPQAILDLSGADGCWVDELYQNVLGATQRGRQLDRWPIHLPARDWRRWLETRAQTVEDAGLRLLVCHSAPPPIDRQLRIDAESFTVLAANAGLFNSDPVGRYPRTSKVCLAAVHALDKRDYVVRHATERDLARLSQLEELCWQHTRTSPQQLQARLQRYPAGQFVLEKDGQVLGVIYSQRIAAVETLASRSAADVHELHDESGSIVQLLALNVDPQAQNLSLGGQLLEFMLQRCSLIDGVDRVVGVTLCKRFDARNGLSFDEYIHRQDGQQDPVLALHRSHGAAVVGSIVSYRPEDAANQGCGVLVSYDIHHRQTRPRGDVLSIETSAARQSAGLDRQEIERVVRAQVGRMIGAEHELDAARPLMEMGLTSADLLQLQLQMERQFGCTLRPGFFFEHSCIDKVVAYFAPSTVAVPGSHAARQAAAAANVSSKAIAIVGMSCRLPGGIETPDDLWRVLAAADCVISSYPRTRGSWPSAVDYPGIDQGGYLADADAFDASFFRLSPAEAQITDPQQRISLELAWSCLEDAGVLPAHLRGTRTGVFIGASNCDYSRLIQAAGLRTVAHYATGSSSAIIANRLSYFLDLSGPSMLIDTACSSSLVALHSAIQSMHAGECEAALVGGVNFICHPELSVAYHEAGMLARDGRCKAFDARANGYVRAEGAVMLLLKPLSAAIRAQDNIHAVISGSAVNHGGLSGGLTVPDPKKQSELLVAAWNSAGISPRALSYIEAHGTGTSLGDPIEVQGIQTAYSTLQGAAGGSGEKTCAVGSIKSNLGHLEPAAGIAGVLKVVLSMKHRQLPALPTFETLNPKIALNDTPFYIPERHQHWHASQPRLAGVSSFGSGGANAHCVVQEYVADIQDLPRAQDDDHLFVISAADPTRLRACAGKVVDWLGALQSGRQFVDAIYTWQIGRAAMKWRLAIKVKDAADLRNKLQQWLSGPSGSIDTWSGEVNSRDPSASRSWQGEAGTQRVEQALADRNLDQLAVAWTSGVDVDWRKLYAADEAIRPRRISVPTYSFAKERHWIEPCEIGASDDGDATKRWTPAAGHLLVTPVWQAAPATSHDAAPSGGFREHRVVLCEMAEVDDEKIRVLAGADHCLHLRCQGQPEGIGERYVGHALSCFEEVKRILAGNPRGRVLLQVVIPQQPGATLLTGLSGLLSTATRENPHLLGQIILTEAGLEPDALAEQLRREKDLSSDTLVKYSHGRRHTLRWQEVRAQDPPLLAFKHDGVYLITGGLGGLGKVFAKEILRQAARARIVLTGRSAPSGEQRRSLDELARLAAEKGGFAPEYRQLDPTDLDQTRTVIDAVTSQHQRIDGIIHSAGMISDSFILKKTVEGFKRVLAPKVAGTLNLDAASRDLQLDFLVLFSSFASAIGNLGQADYAAANGFMDQFAAHRNDLVDVGQRLGQTLSIHWPFWREGGMAMDPQSVATLRAATGMQPMPTAIGLRAFHDSLWSRNSRTMVLAGDIEKLQQTVARANRSSAASTATGTSVALGSELLREATLQRIKQLFGEAIKLPAAKVAADEPLSSYGIDSILINMLNRKLAEVFGEISKTLFFEHKTLAELAEYLIQEHEAGCVAWTGLAKARGASQGIDDVPRAVATVVSASGAETAERTRAAARGPGQEPIAIIGISGIYPQAPTLEEFWKNLESGRNCVSEIPPERWALEGFYVADVEQAVARGRSYSKWGAFIEQFAQFEPLFFNISPREALNMDPQERLFLQEAWRALESAGYTRDDLRQRFRRKVGVFAGITKTGFELYATPAASVGDGFFPHTSFSSVANRVSYFLDITGPSLPIDTMCSSSLTAIHQACEHINRGECELAFAGGVNLYLHPSSYTWLCSQRMLSRDGLCRSFGAGGSGYVPGEGVGVVLLKSLSSAVRDNDNIHGIILATHVNHGGSANGYTVPSPRAQAELISHTIRKAGIEADAISYVEAHGTGTQLGDPIEISGLQQAFATRAGSAGPCSVGSAKSNIGHLEAAAGIAGLTKVLLQMKHQAIAPSLHATQLNPDIDFDKTPFRVNRSLSPWPARREDGSEAPRIAAISSFGAGGANAHIIVQEFRAAEEPGSVRRHAGADPEQNAIVLSAGTSEQLRLRARDLLTFVQAARGALDLRSMAYTLQVGREAMRARLGILASSVDQLIDKLQAHLAGANDIEDVYQGQVKSNKDALRLFAGDDDFQVTLERWLARRKFSKLLELWTKGLDVPWDKLYGAARPRRMALPTHPFAKERYWVDAVEGVRAWDAVAGTVHPLLHTNTSDLNRQSYTSVFTGEEFFLRDHQVQGHKVLPAVAYLEMARAAVDLASPTRAQGRILELCHTAWLQPLVVSSPRKVVIALYLNEREPLAVDFAIHSADADAAHCQGQARWIVGQAVPAIDIQQLKAQMLQGPLDVAEFYGCFTQMGISYGPAHRAITALYRGEQQLLVQLNLPDVLESTRQSYLLHPSLMDSALQGCMALLGDSVRQRRGPLLPFALNTLRVVAPCSSEMFAWVRRSNSAAAATDQFEFDVDLCDRLGNVCVQMHGFSLRPLDAEGKASSQEPPALESKVATTAQLYSLVPAWSRILRRQQDDGREHSPASVLLLGEHRAPLDWLRTSLPQAEFLQLPENASSDDIRGLLEQRAFERLLWIAPDVSTSDGDAESHPATVLADQERGVLAVFRIAKALLSLNRAEERVQWTLITRRTQNVRNNDRISPTHGAISGLVGSLAREYPEWNLQLLDVDDLDALSAAECLSLPWNKQGYCLAHRQGEWLVEGLARVGELPQSLAAYRQGGVYIVIGGAGGIGEVWSRFMVEHYQAELVWIGRRPLDATIEGKLQALARLGPAPRYFSADATRLDSLQAACENIRKVHPRIHGVVHSAIVLQDQSLSRMEEATFRSSLAAKIDVSVNMDAVFGGLDLDFMVFFSSLISFTKTPGQANYAAGCTFKDSFAHALGRRRGYPIKIVNWGYWGNVGVVASEFYKRRMQRLGWGSIEAEEAMDALQALVSSDVGQLVLVKAIDARALEDMSRPETVSYVPSSVTNVLPLLQEKITAGEPPRALQESVLPPDVCSLAEQILAANLRPLERSQARASASGAAPDHPRLGRWLDASVEYLRRQGALQSPLVADVDALWAVWDANEAAWQRNPNTRAHLALLKACLQALPDILTGTRRAADVMFPDSSLRLVSGVYAGNALADYYNDVLGQTLCACIRQRRQADPSSRIRILEIGAGTGGTTTAVLPMLREFDGGIEEYCYTDVSKAFLIHAEEHYRPVYPALHTALFDASKPLSSQSVAANHYDFVIATNVLHATADIREALRNAKALLKKHGIILLNEMCEWSLFNHLTFGLLDGWWLYEDAELRLPGSPGLAPQTWGRVLEEEGFETICFPAERARALGQQIIVASSDGRVRQRVPELPRVIAAATSKREVVAKAATPLPGSIAADLPPATLSLRDKAVSYVQGIVAKALRMKPAQVEPSRPLAEYGLDSIVVVGLTSQLRRTFPGVTTTLFFEVRSIDGFADFILEHNKEELIALLGGEETSTPVPQRQPVPSQTTVNVEARKVARPSRRARPGTFAAASGASAAAAVFDVAVIGLAGRYPQSATLSEFWNNLANGRNCITEVPKERWDWQAYFDAERGKAGKTYTKWGGFLDDIDKFDPLFFRIAPKEAKKIDPQERLFLETSYHAIEDSGYTPATLAPGGKVGVFVGVMNSRYTVQPLFYSIANRVSFLFDFSGPSLAVDSACSSSLTSIHLALDSLYSGMCEAAIAGGVSLIVDPQHMLELTALGMLSEGAQCRSFGRNADGFVDAEGVGAVVLKPLDHALRDGDTVYAVIKGSALNAGGRTHGYTVPNPAAQAEVVSSALARANIDSAEVSYIEAHGTGTALGDPIEVAGLTKAFRASRCAPANAGAERQHCAIGSLKSNIGHCESAAGIAALTKVLLQFRHGQLVPTLHADEVNDEIDFATTPFRLQRTLAPWHRPVLGENAAAREVPRIAGISSFGAGGANAHLVLQEPPSAPVNADGLSQRDNDGACVVPLSARTSEQLQWKIERLLGFLQRDAALRDIAYTLQVGREAMDERIAFVAMSLDDLRCQVQALSEAAHPGPGPHRGSVRNHKEFLAACKADPAFTERRDGWLVQRDLARIAEHWVKGVEIDWARLHAGARPRRIPLPTYPFARDRHWIEPQRTLGDARTAAAAHPLLQRNTSTLRGPAYSVGLKGDERFLAQDAAGRRRLPALLCLEMARAAIAAAYPDDVAARELRFEDVVADDAILVDDDGCELHIALLPDTDDVLGFEIYLIRGGLERVHCQGRASFAAQDAQDAQDRADVAALAARLARGVPANAVHDRLATLGVHGLRAHRLARTGREVVLEFAAEAAGAESWTLPPDALASVPLAAAWLLDELGQTPAVPSDVSLRAVQTVRLWSGGERPAYLVLSHRDDDSGRCDIALYDAHGKPCLHADGLHLEWTRAFDDALPSAQGGAAQGGVIQAAAAALAETAAPTPTLSATGTRIAFLPPAASPEAHARTGAVTAKPNAMRLREVDEIDAVPALRPTGTSRIALPSPDADLGADSGADAPPACVELRGHGSGVFSIALLQPVLDRAVIAQLLLALEHLREREDTRLVLFVSAETNLLHGSRDVLDNAIAAGLYRAVVEFPLPTVAVLGGGADGPGFLLGALCDFMVCARESRYGFDPERGAQPTPAEAALLAARFGDAWTEDLIYVSGTLSGRELAQKGWTVPVVARDDTMAAALSLAECIATKPRDSLHLLKTHMAAALQDCVSRLGPHDRPTADASDAPPFATVPVALPQTRPGITVEYLSDAAVSVRFADSAGDTTPATLLRDLRATLAELAQHAVGASVVLCSDLDGFLPAIGEAAEAQRVDSELAALQQVLCEYPSPVVVAFEGDADGAGWLLGLSADACVHAERARYSTDALWRHPSLLRRAAVLFAHRLGANRAKRCLFEPAAVAGAELASGAAVVRGDAADVLAHAAWALAGGFPLRSPALRARRRAAVLARLADAFVVSDSAAGDTGRVKARRPMPEFPAIETELRGNGVLVVRMVDREAKNMFSPALVRGLEEVFAHIEASGDYRAVVLCGYDTYFACGGTRDSLLAIQQGGAKFTDTKIYQLPMSCSVPVVAAMQGHAIGGGWTLGMFADLCVFSAESRYISPYMQYGFTPGAGSTLIFPTTLGPDLARETLFAAVEYSGSELRAKGLPHTCIPRDEVLPHALVLADAIAARAPADVRALKRYFADPGLAVIEDTYARELAMHDQSFVGKAHALQGVIRHFQAEEDAAPVSATMQAAAAPAEIAHALKDMLAAELQMDAAQIDEDTQFVDLGLDSIIGVTWVRRINAAYGTGIEATKVYSYPTLRQFCDFVVERVALRGAVRTQSVANAAKPGPSAAKPASSPAALSMSTTTVATKPVATDADAAEADLSVAIRHLLAQELHMPEEEIDAHRQFVDLGLDSITGVTWVRRINAAYGTRIEATKVYSYPTLAEFARFLAGLLPARPMQSQRSSASAEPVDAKPLAELVRPAAPSARALVSWRDKATRRITGTDAIAIIGMAGQFPHAGDLDAFWRNIAGGKDCIDTVPPQRWDIERYFSEDISIPGTTNSRWMGVLDDCDAFDPLFFNISPTEAESMDPQQRLMLQNCWHAIENAAIDPRSLSGSRCGVFVGCGATDYHQRSREHQFSSQGFTGAAMSILAARIAYFLNLQGPCLSIDTACSSSLVAIANACDSLVAGNCDLALAGGVAVMAGPTMHVKTGQSGMLSVDGRCFAFDHRANGFVPSEGVGALMLKRLADAERDGDIVHAVIRGWGVNQDGKTNGITAPNPVSQTRLMRAVYDRFGIDPEDIQLIEAHGTGTKLGDPIEVEGLTQAFRHYTGKTGYCALGSVKGNIGHTLYAAGVAGALKLVLALKHRQLPPAASFERLNPHIDLSDSPFVVNTALKPWPENAKGGRSAVISSFGFSGTNAHLVLEAVPMRAMRRAAGHDVTAARPALIPLSARTTEQLRQRAQSLADALADGLAARIADDDAQATPSLHDIAYTLQVGREAMEERCALVAHSLVELEARLRAFAAERTPADMHVGSSLSRAGKLAFIGQDAELRAVLIDTCLRHGKLDKLAELWVDGVDLPWAKLYPAEAGRGPRRVELPLYPFARERYWLEDDAAAVAQRAEGATKTIHPLLHVNASTLRQQRYRSTFDGSESFLHDHRVRFGEGRVEDVLPGVAYLEMAAAAIADALPDASADTASGHATSSAGSHGRLMLRDVVWWRPIMVDRPMAVEIELGVEDDGVIVFEIATGSGDGRVLHCQGEACFVDTAGERMADAGLLASAQRGERWSGDEIYAAFAQMGLHYGPSHRGIRAISRVGGKLLADVALPAIAGDAYRMPPGIMDSALQACIGFLPSLQALPQAPSVPFALRSLTLHAPCPSEVVVVLTPAAGAIDGSGGHAAVESCDVSIFDTDGALCVDIRGFGWRPVDGARVATLAGSRDAGGSDRARGFDGVGMPDGTGLPDDARMLNEARMVDATPMYDEASMHEASMDEARTQQSRTSDETEMFDETFYRELLESISRKDVSAEDAVELGLPS